MLLPGISRIHLQEQFPLIDSYSGGPFDAQVSKKFGQQSGRDGETMLECAYSKW